MALAGLHVVFSYVQTDESNVGALMNGIAGSSTITTGQTSAAAPNNSSDGQPIAHLVAAEDGYFAIGKTPNATVNPRGFLRATDAPLDIFINSGDKVSWLTA